MDTHFYHQSAGHFHDARCRRGPVDCNRSHLKYHTGSIGGRRFAGTLPMGDTGWKGAKVGLGGADRGVGCERWRMRAPADRPRTTAAHWSLSRPSATVWCVTPTEIIEEIGTRLARAAPKDSRVVLFGSYARDQADAGSDYDVLVIEPEVADAAGESVRLRAELGDLLVPIDVVVVDQALAARRATVRGTLVERALREGRDLAHT